MAARNDAAKEKRPAKRAHWSLTIDQIIEILDQIGKKSYKILSEMYGVGVSTISDIKSRGPEIRSYKRKAVEMGCQRPVKTMKLGKDQELEEALFVWFRQKREEGVPLTDNLAIIYKGSSSLQNSLETTFTLRVFVLLVLKLF